jgi:hypothetical protein
MPGEGDPMSRNLRCRVGRHEWTVAHPERAEPRDIKRVCRRCGKTTTHVGTGLLGGSGGAALGRGSTGGPFGSF